MHPILQARNLSVTFHMSSGDIHALQSVHWELHEGEILGVIGESGSGKTVNSLSILKLLPPHAHITGTIMYKGADILSFHKQQLGEFRRSKVGYIFQEPSRSFDPSYSIGKTFEETLRVTDPALSKEDIYQQTLALLREVHIPHPEQRLKNIPAQFSGGMLQRIMIALALSRSPEILIADEPTTALDVTIEAEIIYLLRSLQKSRKLSILFTSHNTALVFSIASRIMVMKDGKVVECGDSKSIQQNPQHEYTKYLIDSVIHLEE